MVLTVWAKQMGILMIGTVVVTAIALAVLSINETTEPDQAFHQEHEGHFGAGLGAEVDQLGTVIAINGVPTAAMEGHLLVVLRQARDHMQALQSTEFGSDSNARALFAVMEAVDALEGSSEVKGTAISLEGDE